MPEPSETDAAQKADNGKDSKERTTEEVPATKTTPDGIVPLFFSGPGQEIFGCVADSDVTVENPHKLIAKEMILEDFKNRAAVSDFHPVKKTVMKYPGEELLLVYDYDFKYGENFYLCITEEAKELVLNPPAEVEDEAARKEAEEGEELVPKTPEPKEWVGQGSDLEILDGSVKPGRTLLKYTVSRKRRHFGSPCSFTKHSAENKDSYTEIVSQEDTNFELHRAEVDTAVQAITEKVDAASQTDWLKPRHAAVQYVPRSMSDSEIQSVLKGAELQDFLDKVRHRFEVSLQQNEIMDAFIDDYRSLSDSDDIMGNKSDTNLKEYQSFTDLKFSKDKVITWIDWHPTIKGTLAVSCGGSYSFDERIELSSRLLLYRSLILIWSFADPIHPQLMLEAPDDILCFVFNPTNPNVIAGGCINGQIVLWDIESHQDCLQVNKAPDPTDSRGTAANMAIFDTDPKLDHAPIVQYCATSSIDVGHSMAVCNLHWVPSHIEVCTKTGQVLENPSHMCNQIVSCSIDGTVMFWDIRPQPQKRPSQANQQKMPVNLDLPFSYLDLTWKPFIKIPLPRSDAPGNFSATRVSIKEKQKETHKKVSDEEEESGELSKVPEAKEGKPVEGASTIYCVGTEDGEIVYGDWIPNRDSESGKAVASAPKQHFRGHCGPVCCVERSPFFRDILLSVGGWTFALWKEGAQSDALIKSCSSSVPLTGGAWSPTRPGVFFITKRNGNIDVWDLMDRSHEPSLAQNISSMAITSIHPWPVTSKQLMLAVGDSGGTLHILEVPWSLSHPSTSEVTIMEAFFDRETKRLEFTAERTVLRANEKKALDSAQIEREKEDNPPQDTENWEEQAKKDYEEYLALEKTLLIQLGLIESETKEE